MKKIRVCQCWDDGVTEDIKLIDILHKYNAKATFNLNPGVSLKNERRFSFKYENVYEVFRIPSGDWKSLYDGFQLASHGMTHPHPSSLSIPDFLKDAIDARKYLEDLFQQECPGYAWPYGENPPEYADAMRDAGFAYGRVCHYVTDVTAYNHPLRLSSSCHFRTPEFMEIYEAAKKNENPMFYFWGHSYETKNEPAEWAELERRIKFISEDPDAEWCNVVDIVR